MPRPKPTIECVGMTVDELFDQMSITERAIFFNKLLKYEGYSAQTVSLERLADLLADVKEIRSVSYNAQLKDLL